MKYFRVFVCSGNYILHKKDSTFYLKKYYDLVNFKVKKNEC